ncbi:MAG: ATPase, T2SS/T4P/T4SS family [Verrucomicrobiota bacterium]
MLAALTQLICDAFSGAATDVFLVAGEAPRIRHEGEVVELHPGPIPAQAMAEFWTSCGIDPATHPEADISWQLPHGGRLRVNLYHTLGRLAAALRPIRAHIPSLTELGLPAPLLETWLQRRYGLILVTGPTGSGKSTTVASCLDWINHHLGRHIVTLEDPIEYLFENDRGFFSQREIRQDSDSFASGLRAALRQSPDVLFVGEIRDRETAVTALHAAETGHLVISTLHSSGVVETLERFSHLLQTEATGALNLLAAQLVGILSQQLLPRLGGGLFPALEYLQNEAATRRWILDNKLTELQDHLQKSDGATNCSLLDYLVAAARQDFVDPEIARSACPRPQDFDRAMRGIS